MAMRRGVGIPQPAPAARYKNKNPGFFATFLRLGALFRPKKLGSDRNTANYLVFCVSTSNWKALSNR